MLVSFCSRAGEAGKLKSPSQISLGGLGIVANIVLGLGAEG